MGNILKARMTLFFGHRQILLIVAALGFLVALPSLGSGFFLDDYCHRVIVLTRENVNLFDWYRVGSPRTNDMLQSGLLPWWTYPKSKLVFFRPVAEWLIKLDYLLWPDNVVLMHLHSLFWYALLIGATTLVYRRLMPTSLAVGLAAAMFAFDAGHSVAVTWLANRNSLVAMTGSMIALWCYTQERWRWWLCACILFGITLGCAEAALALSGYFFAYEVFLSKRNWSQRVMRLIPNALIALLWLGFWHRNGYGSAGPSIYTDPATNPVGFFHDMLYRIPFLLFGQFTRLPVEFLSFFDESPARPYLLIGALILNGLIVYALWRILRAKPLAGFYGVGIAIALIPISGVQLSGRSLIYVSFGAAGLLAMYLEAALFGNTKAHLRAKLLPALLLVVHLVVSPVLFVLVTVLVPKFDQFVDTRTLRLPVTDNSAKNLLVLSVKDYETSFFFPLFKDRALSLGESPARAMPTIAHVRALAISDNEFELFRPDEDTLIVRSTSNLVRMRKGIYGFDKGDVVQLDDVTITLLEVNAERAPIAIEYHFKPDVLKTYAVVTWGGQYFVPSHLPAPGDKMRIKSLNAS